MNYKIKIDKLGRKSSFAHSIIIKYGDRKRERRIIKIKKILKYD
jgi:hypothetical protein